MLFGWIGGGAFVRPWLVRGQGVPEKAATAADTLPGAERNRRLKVVFVGAHVDDWTDCAGTLARYTRGGHEVVCFSFTPGDSRSMADMNHMSIDKLAALRREDAVRGTKIIGAQLKILNQHNQNMRVDPEVYDEFNKALGAEKPDVVFGMWPLEFHPDHRAAANIAFNAWLQSGMQFAFYFCETPGGGEMTPQQFAPNRWVDIAPVANLKREAYLANSLIRHGWPQSELWSKFRGAEYGCQHAEAFVRLTTVASMPPENIAPRRWYYGGLRLAHE
jgi:LmbE family N-acetylglucosaminyl deacetylase